MDYGSGALADNGVHMFSVVSWALGTDQTGPATVEATGRQAPSNLYDVPVEMRVRFEFADPPCEVVWEQSEGEKLNLEFVGSKATLSGFWEFKVTAGEADLSPTRPEEIRLELSDNHSGNWVGVHRRSPPRPVMDVGRSVTGVTSWPHLGNIAYRLGRQAPLGPCHRALSRRRPGQSPAPSGLPPAMAGGCSSGATRGTQLVLAN